MKIAAILIFLMANLLVPGVYAQIAYLKSDRIKQGDVAVLIVEYTDDTPSMYALDTSSLDQFFEVISVKPRVERRHENNKIVNVQHWEVTLFPKITGEIIIPPLKIKQSSTPELRLQVIEGNSGTRAEERIWIAVDAYPETPYVGEQILITIKLISSRPILNGALSEPRQEQASLVHLGIDQVYVQTIEGRPFHILQRRLAVFANHAGQLLFPPVRFLGEVDDPNAKGLARQILRRSAPLTLTILEPPSAYTGDDWFAMTDLEISDHWIGLDNNLKPGDSISRTISLRSTGLPSAMLPKQLFKSNGKNLVVYADKAKTEDKIVDGNIVGQVDQTFAVVLTEQGSLQIPELRLDWWDLDDKRQRQATLPAKNLMVAAVSTNTGSYQSDSRVHWLVGFFSFLLLLVMLSHLFLKRTVYSSGRLIKKRLKQTCLNGDAVQSRDLLILWARQQWPDRSIVGLTDINNQFNNSQLRQKLENLDRAIYAPNSTRWQGRQLWEAIVDLKILRQSQQNNRPASRRGFLPGLYPSE